MKNEFKAARHGIGRSQQWTALQALALIWESALFFREIQQVGQSSFFCAEDQVQVLEHPVQPSSHLTSLMPSSLVFPLCTSVVELLVRFIWP